MTFRKPSLAAVVVALIPFVGMCFSVALWDRVEPQVLGLPFNFAWLLVWIVLCSVCIRVVYGIEKNR